MQPTLTSFTNHIEMWFDVLWPIAFAMPVGYWPGFTAYNPDYELREDGWVETREDGTMEVRDGA